MGETNTDPAPNNCALASELGKVNQFKYFKSYDKYPIDDLLEKDDNHTSSRETYSKCELSNP